MKVPNGSIVINNNHENTMVRNNIDLKPNSNEGYYLHFQFYFPEVGTYYHLPSHLYESGELIA